MSAIDLLRAATQDEAVEVLLRCCGSNVWARQVAAAGPFATMDVLLSTAEEVWSRAEAQDVLEALAHHPQIGEDLDALRRKFASTAGWARGEQAGVAAADEATLTALREGNKRYREKFGYTFVVCATGKSAAEMRALLEARLGNPPDLELQVAAREQGRITRIRLEKL